MFPSSSRIGYGYPSSLRAKLYERDELSSFCLHHVRLEAALDRVKALSDYEGHTMESSCRGECFLEFKLVPELEAEDRGVFGTPVLASA